MMQPGQSTTVTAAANGPTPDLSVVIPSFNRTALLRRTLASVQQASSGWRIETIVVDDGSSPPVETTLRGEASGIDQLITQPNQGLLFARLAGLEVVRAPLVLFLDSDDFISREKLGLHIEAMRSGQAEVTYTDVASVEVDATGRPIRPPVPDTPYPEARDSADFFINLQPAPHAPVFRTDFLRRVLTQSAFPPRSSFNPVAEIWFYHKAAVIPITIKRIPGPHAIVGRHPQGRLTDQWEKLGIASLSVMEHFIADTPPGPLAAAARSLVAARAFGSWRRQPCGMPRDLQKRYLKLWRTARTAATSSGDTASFRAAARLFGALPVAWLLRRMRNASYPSIRTLDERTLRELMQTTPPPAALR